MLGTMAYMSPEQVRGASAGAPADVFALGITLYEMAAGHRPFIGPTMTAVIDRDPARRAQCRCAASTPSMPPALERLVHRMLAKDAATASIRRARSRTRSPSLAAGDSRGAVLERGASLVERRTVGREDERETDAEGLRARCASGQGRIVTVLGEPGIGKTNLVEDFLAELAQLPERADRDPRPLFRTARRRRGLPARPRSARPLLHATTWSSVHSLIKTVAPSWYVQVAHVAVEP